MVATTHNPSKLFGHNWVSFIHIKLIFGVVVAETQHQHLECEQIVLDLRMLYKLEQNVFTN